jgi:Ser/Thr protein kinase RdoA (MazF antagonist)
VGAVRAAPSRIGLTPTSVGIDTLAALGAAGALPPEVESRYAALVLQICKLCAPWFETAETQRVHGDCHLGNLLWGNEGPFWVDFDDMVRGPCVQDVWLVVAGRDTEARRQREVLLGAYEQMRAFDRRSLRLIEPLRALRYVHFSAWIARRWKDPAFPRVFPLFGTARYWQEQVADLQEQLELIREGT